MGSTLSRRLVESMSWLDDVAEAVQPKVREAVGAGGTTARNVLDGTPLEAPLHPMVTDVPMGAWTAAVVFDGLDLAGGRGMRSAADASVAVGIVGAVAAAVTGLSDWRHLSGGSRRMGLAHGLLNAAGLALCVLSFLLRATGRRSAGRWTFLAGFSLAGTAAHLGGELSYDYGLRVNRNTFQQVGPDEFIPVLEESELPRDGMVQVEAGGAEILLGRSGDGRICALSSVCGHFGGPLADGEREGDTVVCPLHGSRFDLCTGAVIDGPATFPQSRYETRVRDGKIEIRGSEENIQRMVT